MTRVSRRLGLGLLALSGWLIGRELLARRREEDLRGQVALITGGSRGLGLLLARELGAEGCRLVICARDERELREAREDLEGRGYEALAVRCDVADQRQVEDMVRQAIERFGRVDLLVNNAGVIQVGPLETMTIADYKQAMDVMYWGVVYPTHALLPSMTERGSGRIVNITSIGGRISVPHLLPYSGAKFAAVGFSEGLSAELAGTGVSVTTVVPGLMRTGSFLNALFKGRQEREFAWFSLGASLPGISMAAEYAARRIVRAAKRRETHLTLSLPAVLAERLHGLGPGLVANTLGLVNRLILPDTRPGEDRGERGAEVQKRMPSPLWEAVTSLGQRAARRTQQ